jgi:hypothetical protein
MIRWPLSLKEHPEGFFYIRFALGSRDVFVDDVQFFGESTFAWTTFSSVFVIHGRDGTRKPPFCL